MGTVDDKVNHFEMEQTLPDCTECLAYFPFRTETCPLCPHRTKGEYDPACVKHCMAACMK
jgi:hypothetical protein